MCAWACIREQRTDEGEYRGNMGVIGVRDNIGVIWGEYRVIQG